MAYLTSYLNIIRGYVELTGSALKENWLQEAMQYDNVRDAIHTVAYILNAAKYPSADISEELDTLENGTFGPYIRDAIYGMVKKLATEAGINLYSEVSIIKYAHYGRDMRQALYDAFVKLGAEEDVYVQTTGDDYIWSDLGNNKAILLYYRGGNYPFIIIPTFVEQNETTYVVSELSPFLFEDNTNLIGVILPELLNAIG